MNLSWGSKVVKQSRPLPCVCHFSGCDSYACATVGVTPLCDLHESFILELLDNAVGTIARPNLVQG